MKKFSIVFYNRNFGTKIAIPQEVKIERYSWNMTGGPKTAFLTAPNDGEALDLMQLIRCPVEIYAPDGKCVWYGYVNRVVVPHGGNMVGIGLDAMFNYVKANYSDDNGPGTTSAASDSASIGEYGQKEYIINSDNTSQTFAERVRDMYLAERKYPRPEIEFSGGRTQVSIECKGWFETLDWKYYTNTGTDNVENTTQIEAIVTDCGALLSGSQIEDTAGTTSTEERDGNSTALECIKSLLEAGTSNIRPLLATVDKDRYLHIYERNAEPVEGKTEYVLRPDGNLETNLSAFVPPEHCICAAWVLVKGLGSTLTGMASMRPFFIESAEYNAAQDRTTYRPAGAYEQHALEKFFEKATHDGSINPLPDTVVGGGIASLPYAWSAKVGASESFDSRDLVITSVDYQNLTSTVVFTTMSSGIYIIGISGTSSDPSQQLDASIGGDGSFVPLTSYVPQMSGVPYTSGITYGAVSTLGILDANDVITCRLSSGTSAATLLQCYAWIVKIGN